MSLTWFEGYNACIFAYGQTGAGKTYTMLGQNYQNLNIENESRGLQPRVFEYIFNILEQLKTSNLQNEYIITCNYFEIYNEQIIDLLADQQKINTNARLQIREDISKGVYVDNLSEEQNSKLHFVDLAGSERQKSTGAVGERLKEASNINKSLTVLGQVINALVENSNGRTRHVPYRDMKPVVNFKKLCQL
ncbi:kinesin motor domain protein [Ichthyophthirius multifiliis]|uniref:Kinesin motor domain protein n=1 Tax=Ichthyophthirius multifiliis TaxID=5932 RepID=G0QWR1_ICHMU|nr:kinesin motor domain protein [Ichthyophthirius multifiliis]EGR30348.1 kinesin motor domain protein [Ichthyophthirius multifiliis]|eukprot:XP_004031935.1 kinesin motor domain protein [Ichthyophthirius multifiliis]